MKLNRKWILVMSLVLSLALATGSTLAFLTAKTDPVTNTFTLGNVSISLTEPLYDAETEHVLYPGASATKDPTITNTGRTPAWVWMTLEIPTDVVNHIEMSLEPGWKKAEETKVDDVNKTTTITLLYESELAPGEDNAATAFKKVTLAEDANLGTMEKFDIKVTGYAIQDSFGNVDDAYEAFNAEAAASGKGDDDSVTYTLPEGMEPTTVTSSEELKNALNDRLPVILLKDGEYNWSGTGHNGTAQTVTIYGESKNAILKVTHEGGEGADNDFDGYTVTFNNLTITSDNDWSTGWKRMNATFNDCVINNNLNLVNGNHVFNYCTLNQSANQYNIWTYGASNAEFNYCTFNCAGKSIYVDGNRGGKTVLTVNNCIFNDNGGVENKAAIETGTTYGDAYELVVNNTFVKGFAVNPDGTSTNSTLWANKHSMTSDKLNVVVDGTDIF